MPSPKKSPLYPVGLFLFHRDLRLDDNTTLLAAHARCAQVLPAFICTPEQLAKNPYRSNNAVQFMCESLNDLAGQIKKSKGKLSVFSGDTAKVITRLAKEKRIQAVFSNWDYTPYAHHRDQRLRALCAKLGIAWHQGPDALLCEPELLMKSDHKPYTIFNFFFKKAQLQIRKDGLAKAIPHTFKNWYTKNIAWSKSLTSLRRITGKLNPHIAVHGGTAIGRTLVAGLKKYKDYKYTRHFPALDAPATLWAHVKWGTISIRQVYHAVVSQLGPTHVLMSELYWREFHTYIAYHFPHVFGTAFESRFADLPWDNNKKLFASWCAGRTGFPLVDAGMRQLVTTGVIHDRARLVASSFLVKDLHIDWRWGERYFAQHLVDYDPAVNNGNWQWSASTGCDPQPYFGVFSPWLQGQRWDTDAAYIRQWVPELTPVPARYIHRLFEKEKLRPKKYPAPIVDHGAESKRTKTIYRDLARKARE